MLLRLLGLLAIVAIKELSAEAIQRIAKWMDKQDRDEKKQPLN